MGLTLMEVHLEFLNTVMPWVLLALGSVLALAVTYLLPKLPKLSNVLFNLADRQVAKIDNEYAQGVLERLSVMLRAQALKLENTVIEDLKEMARDGRITLDELKVELGKVKQMALNEVQKLATLQGLWDVAVQIFDVKLPPLPNGQMANVPTPQFALRSWMDDELEAHVSTFPPSGLQTSSLNSPVTAIQQGLAKLQLQQLTPFPMCKCGKKTDKECQADQANCQQKLEELPTVPPTAAS